MRILHVLDSGGVFGKERVVLELLRGMPDANVINLSSKKDFEKEAMRFCDFSFPLSRDLSDEACLELLKIEIRKGDWNIIHCHDYKSTFYVIMYSILHPSIKTKIVRTLHGYTTQSKFSKMFLYQTLDQFLLYFHDKVISVKPDMGYDTILNGISLPVQESIDPHNYIKVFCASHDVVIGSAGRLSKEKNYDTLIRSISGIPNVGLVIFGQGPERFNLISLISELYLEDRVILPGFATNPSKYYDLIDIYIQPSFTEGVPISVLEAAAYSKLLVLTPVGGMKIFIDDGAAINIGTGAENMVSVLRDTIKNLDNLEDVAKRGKVLFDKTFSARTMVDQYRQLYEDIVV